MVLRQIGKGKIKTNPCYHKHEKIQSKFKIFVNEGNIISQNLNCQENSSLKKNTLVYKKLMKSWAASFE